MTNTNSQAPQLVILIGPPGSGKGTQAQLIKDRLGFDKIVSSSAIIREKLKHGNQDDPFVKAAREMYQSGQLVTSEIVGNWTEEKIRELFPGVKHGLIMDGTTRALPEAKIVIPMFKELFGVKNITALYLNVDTGITAKRNMSRLVCHTCQRPVRPGTASDGDQCPFKDCGGIVGRRDIDSDEDVVLKRMEVYKQDTAPVLALLKEEGLLREIDASQKIEEVFSQIKSKIETK